MRTSVQSGFVPDVLESEPSDQVPELPVPSEGVPKVVHGLGCWRAGVRMSHHPIRGS
jgi:hypothetical protein